MDSTTALIVVDVQPDFLPGGALAVADGDAILAPLAALLERLPYALAVATQDWHPPGHASFASAHAGRRPFDEVTLHGHPQTLWPDHCVQGTYGAELHRGLPWNAVSAVVRKGTQRDVDSYSGFRNNWDADGRRPATGLAGYLRERGITDVAVCGLARDFCVKWTAEDAAAAGFGTTVLWELTRSVVPASDARVRADLERAGVRIG
ncbi:nicotinamidase [Roseisolibacter sp. H3M3-2]|uniref:nicotinamidase n=1 Tax=Roseisolibacter sp. H3M3-2 TaxID=3031323 RepID=UPI0023DCDF84|nr:nicotinamidase [Roseisolibacter sp. H3M3-2]MDF1505966.1 nicotinamidase [Roseisolibacter sp. H3M3-2]